MVTALVSTSKPRSDCDTSLATIGIDALARALVARLAHDVVGLGGKPDSTGVADPLRGAHRAQVGQDVARALERQRQRRVLLGDLAGGAAGRRVVGHRRRHDHQVHRRPRPASPPRASRRRCARAPASPPAGGVDRRRAGHQRHLGAARGGLGRQREPHAAARPVADVAHRVDVLVGRPGGDQHLAAAQRRIGCRADAGLRRGAERPASTRTAASTMSSGSARRPLPIQPQAR